jgi:hypothetical protein
MDSKYLELAKKIFPEGCKYSPQSELVGESLGIVGNAHDQILNSIRRNLGPRYEHVCYNCEDNCSVRKFKRHDAKNRWAYLSG